VRGSGGAREVYLRVAAKAGSGSGWIMSLCALCLRVRGAHPHHVRCLSGQNWRRGWTECEISRTTRHGDGGEAEAGPLVRRALPAACSACRAS
jgi:hypothetical protein